MDYFPFPSVRASEIGPFDFAVIKAVYANKRPDESYRFCSDADSTGGVVAPDRLLKQANCNQFDIGDAASWYIRLSQLSDDGIFAKDLADPSKDWLDHLASFLTEKGGASISQRMMVQSFLCKKPQNQINTIRARLTDGYQVPLVCPTLEGRLP